MKAADTTRGYCCAGLRLAFFDRRDGSDANAIVDARNSAFDYRRLPREFYINVNLVCALSCGTVEKMPKDQDAEPNFRAGLPNPNARPQVLSLIRKA